MRRITPDMDRETAQRIATEESGDLRARWLLLDLFEATYNARDRVAASLLHAVVYLENRERYTAEPWPEGMIR